MAVLDDMSQCVRAEIEIDWGKRGAGYVMLQPHYHSYYEIYYLLKGQSRMFINQDICYLHPGDALVIPPMEIHRVFYEENQEAERYRLCFTKESARGFCGGCGLNDWEPMFTRYKVSFFQEQKREVQHIFEQMEHESHRKDSYAYIQMQSLLYQFLSLFGRSQEAGQQQEVLRASEESIMRAVCYMHRHFDENLTLEHVSQAAHMSPSYFSRKFKGTAGLGFKEYLNYIRLQKASSLLGAADETITNIALACGFSDGNYFGDVFKQAKGMPPSRFRREIRGRSRE